MEEIQIQIKFDNFVFPNRTGIDHVITMISMNAMADIMINEGIQETINIVRRIYHARKKKNEVISTWDR